MEKEINFELLDISYRNGERTQLDYDYRKKKFDSKDELETYRDYLQKKLNKELFFTYKETA